MIAVLADPTFLSLRWDAWGAIAVWVTLGAYVALAVFARRQLRESRELRRQQARPFVIAQVKGRSILVFLMFHNIGTTQARKVVVTLAEPLRSAECTDQELGWQFQGIFDSGMPTMAPGEQVKFFLDTMPSRIKAELPMAISGTIAYEDVLGARYSEPFHIDLNVYGPAMQSDHDVHDLVTEIETIRKTHEKATAAMVGWSQSRQGLVVRIADDPDDT